MSQRLPAVDAYIANAKPFAQPILRHLRETVHRAAPEVEEQIKWSRPFFVLRNVILGNMSAFSAHCSFGLWGSEIVDTLRAGGISSADGMGTFGKITSLADLPPATVLEGYVRQAAELIGSGERTRSIQRVAKPARPAIAMPEAFASALEKSPAAAASFARLSPSCRREYTAWIGGAKRAETQARRVASALERIAAGERLNAKYAQPT